MPLRAFSEILRYIDSLTEFEWGLHFWFLVEAWNEDHLGTEQKEAFELYIPRSDVAKNWLDGMW